MPELPFIVGKPAIGDHFVDRKDEMGRLLKLVEGVQQRSSSNTVLVGLRRTEKDLHPAKSGIHFGTEKEDHTGGCELLWNGIKKQAGQDIGR